jgi:TonB family protein
MNGMTIMRRLAIATALFLALVEPASAETFRSSRYLVSVTGQPSSGASRHYAVTLFDAASRTEIARLQMVSKGGAPAVGEITASATHFTVRIVPHGDEHLVKLTADDGITPAEVLRAHLSDAARPAPRNERAHAKRAGRDLPEPRVLRRVDAIYTEEAKAAGASGTVVVEVLVDRGGFVREAVAVKAMGHGLTEAAVDAAKQWLFAPSTLDGAPISLTHEVTFDFRP